MEKVKKMRTLSFLQGTILVMLKQSILFLLLWLIFRNVLSPGELISMQFISTALIGPLQDLGNIIVSWREAETALGMLNDILEKPVEYSPEDWVETGPISELDFKDVVFRHKNATSMPCRTFLSRPHSAIRLRLSDRQAAESRRW